MTYLDDKAIGSVFDKSSRRIRNQSVRVAVAALLALFLWMAMEAHLSPHFAWDNGVYESIRSISIPGFQSTMLLVSALGSDWIAFGLVIAAGFLLALRKLRLEALICVAGVGIGSALNLGLKTLIARPRPNELGIEQLVAYEHHSFPSGHTVFFVELFGFLILLSYYASTRRMTRLAVATTCALLISLIGISRIYLGAHWASDVTGGYMLGCLWLMAMTTTYRRLKTRRSGTEQNQAS